MASYYANEMTSAYRRLSADMSLPDDAPEYRDPGNTWQCWVVCRVVGKKALAHPRQCQQRRRGPAAKGGKTRFCCQSHRRQESTCTYSLYEAGKAEVAATATSASEYEKRIGELARSIGI